MGPEPRVACPAVTAAPAGGGHAATLARRRRRGTARAPAGWCRVLRWVLAAAALGFVVLALVSRWDEVREPARPGVPRRAAARLRAGLRRAGHQHARLAGAAGRPGQPAAGAAGGPGALPRPAGQVPARQQRVGDGRADRAGPRLRRAAQAGRRVAALVLNLVILGLGLQLALLALPALLHSGAPGWLRWSPVLVPVGLACLTPPLLTRLCNLAAAGAAPGAAGARLQLARDRRGGGRAHRHLAAATACRSTVLGRRPRRRPGRASCRWPPARSPPPGAPASWSWWCRPAPAPASWCSPWRWPATCPAARRPRSPSRWCPGC